MRRLILMKEKDILEILTIIREWQNAVNEWAKYTKKLEKRIKKLEGNYDNQK